MRIRARRYSALRISTRCCSPTDSCQILARGSMGMPNCSATLATSRSTRRGENHIPRDPRAHPRIMFSATVSGRTSRKCWWTMKIPASCASRGERKRHGAPSSSTCPSSGRYRPVRTLQRVVLPAPFSPSRAWISPGSTSNSTRLFATTPGKRFVMSRAATTGALPPASGTSVAWSGTGVPPEGDAGCPAGIAGSFLIARLALGAADNTLDEPAQGVLGELRGVVRVPDRQGLAGRQADRPVLLRERAAEGVERPGLYLSLPLQDGGLRGRGDRLPERRDVDHSVRDASVVEAALPGAVQHGLDLADVVRRPVVDGRRLEGVRCERALVRVVTGPLQPVGRRHLADRRVVHAIAEDVHSGWHQALCGRPFLGRVEPGVGPHHPDRGTGVHVPGAHRVGVDLPDHLWNRVRRDVADLPGLGGVAGGHACQIVTVLAGPEIL